MSDIREAAAMLRATAADMAMQLDEIRLPLQILLDNHFGDLNDNQEEMLGAARAAADRADESVRRAITVLTAQDGTLELRHDRLHVGELVEGMLGPIRVIALERKVRLTESLAAPFPSMNGDRVQLQLALRTLGVSVLAQAAAGSAATFTAAAEKGWLAVELAYDGPALAGMPLLFGASLVSAHGGSTRAAPGHLTVRVPVEGGRAPP